MSKVIVGVHGLANKPPEAKLKDWWKRSIQDGLKHLEMPGAEFEFDLAFWASSLYKEQQHTDELMSFDPLYNEEPYVEPGDGKLREYKDGWADQMRAWSQAPIGKLWDFTNEAIGENPLVQVLVGKVFRDLDFYYDPDRKLRSPSGDTGPAHRILDTIVQSTLEKHRGKEIMLIAHSMGSIIAYNAMRNIGQSESPFDVHSFVTIGSPLGLTYVRGKIVEERQYDPDNMVRTPTIVSGSWKNFSDKRDKVCADERLRDDFRANARGVQVQDDLIFNDYTSPAGKENPHKSYGYLRAPELARHIRAFLEG